MNLSPSSAFPSNAAPKQRAGFTMVEIMLVIVVMGILMTMGVPKSSTTFENAGVKKAVSEMESIWLSQRRFRMEYGTFAPSLKALVQEGFLSETFLKKHEPYEYQVQAKSRGRLKIRAVRAGGSSWAGAFTLNEMGELKGKVTDRSGNKIEP